MTEKTPVVECETCAPILYDSGTWRCPSCGALNINKWSKCWKCSEPRPQE